MPLACNGWIPVNRGFGLWCHGGIVIGCGLVFSLPLHAGGMSLPAGAKVTSKGRFFWWHFFDCFAVVGRGILFGTIWTVNKY